LPFKAIEATYQTKATKNGDENFLWERKCEIIHTGLNWTHIHMMCRSEFNVRCKKLQQEHRQNFPIANASHHEVRRDQNYCSLSEAATKMMALVLEKKAEKSHRQ
jgi:hypothetical protein